jgi:hypothetical protein
LENQAEGGVESLGAVPLRQVVQLDVSTGSINQGVNRRAAAAADDQVAFPVSTAGAMNRTWRWFDRRRRSRSGRPGTVGG